MQKEDCIRLIKVYRSYPFLWDPNDKAHHNRAKRNEAWKEMSKTLQRPVPILKSKIKSLMGSYRSERSREKKSKTSGSGNETTYESKWFAYKHFAFLKNKYNLNPTSNSKSEEFHFIPVDDLCDTAVTATPTPSPGPSTSTAASQEGQDRTLPVPAAKERRHRKRPLIDETVCQPWEIHGSTDPYLIYALNLANELKKYDARTLAHVKRDIANILFEADMGQIPSHPLTSFVRDHPQVYLPHQLVSSPRDYGSETPLVPSPHGNEHQQQDTEDEDEKNVFNIVD